MRAPPGLVTPVPRLVRGLFCAAGALASDGGASGVLSREDLVDLPVGDRRHDDARVGEAAVEPEREPRVRVRLGDLVPGADRDALVVADRFDDLDLLLPGLDAEHLLEEGDGL